jgi:transcriptional regulator with XRE-family HTH domain
MTRESSKMTPADFVDLRKAMGFGQAAMADCIGMSLRSYQALEAGESTIRTLHILAMERAAEKVAVATKDPTVAPLMVRRDAIELAKMVLQGAVEPSSHKQFKLVEIELNSKGEVVSRNVSPVPFPTKAAADAAAEQSARSLWAQGYNDEHGYWWARDLRDVNYRFIVEPY